MDGATEARVCGRDSADIGSVWDHMALYVRPICDFKGIQTGKPAQAAQNSSPSRFPFNRRKLRGTEGLLNEAITSLP